LTTAVLVGATVVEVEGEAVAVATVAAVVVFVDPEVVPAEGVETPEEDAADDEDADAELADDVTEAELADDAEEALGVLKEEMIPFPLMG
jgi:hypothetical protein